MVRFGPRVLDILRERELASMVNQALLQRPQETASHDEKHARCNAVSDVLRAKFQHDFLQHLCIRSEHVERCIDHFNQVSSVRSKTFRLQHFVRVGVHVNWEAKEKFGLSAFSEKTDAVQGGIRCERCRNWVQQSITQSLTAEHIFSKAKHT
jgi:hypothetical protein